MHVTRHKGAAAVLLAMLVTATGLPLAADAAVTPAAHVQAVAITAAMQHAGLAVSRRAPLSQRDAAFDVAPQAATLDVTPTDTVTATSTVTPTSTNTPTATATPTLPPSATPPPSATATPRPTSTPTPRPTATATPRPTSTPTLRAATVQLLQVGVYRVTGGHEQHVRDGALGTRVRLKMVVRIANAPRGGVRIIASWALRGAIGGKSYLSYHRAFTLHNGRTGLYDDVVLPGRGLAAGAYLFVGSITYRGTVQERATMLHVSGVSTAIARPMRVHYAHLRLTVPGHWFLDFQKDARGRPATGSDTLFMFSDTRRAAVSVVSVRLDATPSTADLQAFPALVLNQVFSGVSNVKTISYKAQIDGHDVFAAEGDVVISGRPSHAIAIVTNKNRQFYAFNVVNYFKHALPSEIAAGLASIFGSKLD